MSRGIGLAWVVAMACNAPERDASPRPEPAPVAAPPLAPVARVQSTDAWLDLIAQRPNAVVVRDDRLVVDLSQEFARKHLAMGFRDSFVLGQEIDGRRATVVRGLTGAFDLPVDAEFAPAFRTNRPREPVPAAPTPTEPPTEPAPQPAPPGLALALTLRPLAPQQSVTVLWNERPLAHLPLLDKWDRRTLTVPDDQIRPGENRLRLHFRRVAPAGEVVDAAGAVAMIELGDAEAVTKRPLPRKVGWSVEPQGGGRATLRVDPGTSIVYYSMPVSRSKLVLQVRGQGALEVRASTDADHREGRAPKTLLDEPLRSAGRRIELDLTGWGGAPLRLELRVRGTEPTAGAVIDEAAIVAERSVPVDRRAREPRDIVVFAVEGMRADALAVGARPVLPAFEAFEREALVFDAAYSASPTAVPSHAAWLSSVAPPMHLTVQGTFLADRQLLLGEALARAGHRRAFVTANPDINRSRGLLQGFDVHEILGGAAEDDSASAVVARMFSVLEDRPEKWFVVANVNDPQAPYEPPRELIADVVPPEGSTLPHLTHIWVARVRIGKVQPTPEQLAYVRRLYRGELQVVDEALAELVQGLEQRKRLDQAIVVVMGVHGEEFLEHGGAGHGRTLNEESLRVPLMIRAPSLLAPGRVEAPIDLVDLAPTLADLVGAAPSDAWQGESLVPVIDDPRPPPRLVLAYLGDGSTMGLVGPHKLVLGPGRGEHYVDLVADPAEAAPADGQGGIGLRLVRSALAWQVAYATQWRRARWGTGANLESAFALDLGM